MIRAAVITIAHGRHAHWRTQEQALARLTRAADDRILVVIDDDELATIASVETPAAHVVTIDADPLGLPLSRARNAGAHAALQRGADLLIFLDVDCLPAPGLVDGYVAAADALPGFLLSGPVTYLDPAPGGYDVADLGRLDSPHPARPAPAPGETRVGGSHDLFWSLSFAVDRATWRALGGFFEGYVGYGGEDTDFARTAAARGVQLAWVGSARAYHQHHAVENPPIRHLDAILRNGAVFYERWGWWPMGGWLDAFERLGLVESVAGGTAYRRTPARS